MLQNLQLFCCEIHFSKLVHFRKFLVKKRQFGSADKK